MSDVEADLIKRLVMMADYRDEISGSHVERLSQYCSVLGEALGMPPNDVSLLAASSPLHDVGKIGLPDAILLKPGKLDATEWTCMQQHTTIGHRILSGSPSMIARAGAVIALSHHERWDGTGYPQGSAEEQIPLVGRICAVADTFDALTSERPYKRALPNDMALQIMEEGRGEHFDPKVFDQFIRHWERILAIQKKYWAAPHDTPYAVLFRPSTPT